MKVRNYGIAVLLVAGVVPLGAFAALSIARSERTAIDEVAVSNERLAHSVAERIAAHADGRRELLRAIGAAALRPGNDRGAAWVLDDYALQYPHLRELAVYDASGRRLAGPPAAPADEPAIAAALAGRASRAPIDTDVTSAKGIGSSQYVVEPVVLVGKPIGVVAARVDLVDTWEPIHSIRVGARGFARLVTTDGVLLAHGDAAESRGVFADSGATNRRILAAARTSTVSSNARGVEVVAAAAPVPGQDWVVIIEQPVAEAFAQARAMKRTLYWLVGLAVLLVVGIGVMSGRHLVGGLERLRAHTAVLAAGDLRARLASDSRIAEVRALATALDDMAASIDQLHEQAKARERLTTFARVAASLAHDLRVPIETVRAACTEYAAHPDDEGSRELFQFMREKELPRLQRYVADLQRIAHEGDVPLRLERFDARALLDELVADMAATPKWQGVELAAAGQSAQLLADRDLIRRAVYNLAANAADACLSRGASRTVRVEVDGPGDDGFVALRVRDDGPGIDPDALARLLAGDFASTKRSSGVGLGFGVARHVAHAHGGEIRGESEVGKGSTFALRLPAAGPGAPSSPVERPPAAVAAPAASKR